MCTFFVVYFLLLTLPPLPLLYLPLTKIQKKLSTTPPTTDLVAAFTANEATRRCCHCCHQSRPLQCHHCHHWSSAKAAEANATANATATAAANAATVDQAAPSTPPVSHGHSSLLINVALGPLAEYGFPLSPSFFQKIKRSLPLPSQ